MENVLFVHIEIVVYFYLKRKMATYFSKASFSYCSQDLEVVKIHYEKAKQKF